MSYLVTGAGGFIGQKVIWQLCEQGEQVVALDSDAGTLERFGDHPAVSPVRGDVADLARVAEVLQTHEVTRIVHLAALLHSEGSRDPGACIRVNVAGTYNVLEAAKLTKAERVVTASSGAIFGTADRHPGGVVANDAPLFATNLYEASKIFGESLTDTFAAGSGISAVSMRVGLAYGHGSRNGYVRKLMDALIYDPLSGMPTQVPWGDDALNWIYIDDAARVFVTAAQRGPDSGAYNVRGDLRPLRDAVDIASTLIPGSKIEVMPGRSGWASDYDDAALQREFGVTCSCSLEDGLKATLTAAKADMQ